MAKITQFTSGMSYGYFVTGEKTILVDTGSTIDADGFRRHAAQAGVVPEEIELIILTHEHGDHFFRLDVIRDLCGAKVLCHAAAENSVENGLRPRATVRKGRQGPGRDGKDEPKFEPLPCVKPDIVIDCDEYDLSQWGVDGKLMYTPGHSRGSYSLFTGDSAIIGDLMVGDYETDEPLTAVFADDEARLKSSIRLIIESGVKMVYSGHFRPCSIDELRKAYEEEWAREGE